MVLELAAPLALSVLGHGYAAAGTGPLRILLISLVPMTFVQAYYVVGRARRRLTEATTATVSGLAGVTSAAIAGQAYGLEGVAIAWVVVQLLAGAWAAARLAVIARAGDGVHPDRPVAPMTLTELEPVTTPAVDAPAPPAEVGRAPRRVSAGVVGPAGLVVVSLAFWALSLGRIDAADISDLGLVSVLPATFYAGLVVLVGSFSWTLATRRAPGWLYLAHVGALVLMLHGTPAIIEEVPRFAVTWRHAGITDYIVQHGSVDPGIDAYFNWPGFFILCAAFQELAGLSSMTGLARWGSLFFELLYLAPLLMIFRGFTHDRRVIWAAVFLFYATNWIGQDYFSPQAESLFLFLVIVGIVVRWFPAPAPAGTPSALARFGGQRAALMATLILVFAAIVPSHQLTPFMALIGVAALVVFKRSDARGLPTLMAVMIAAWVVFMTVAYLSGHIEKITGSVGVGQTVGANVNDHVAGSAEHLLVIKVRLASGGRPVGAGRPRILAAVAQRPAAVGRRAAGGRPARAHAAALRRRAAPARLPVLAALHRVPRGLAGLRRPARRGACGATAAVSGGRARRADRGLPRRPLRQRAHGRLHLRRGLGGPGRLRRRALRRGPHGRRDQHAVEVRALPGRTPQSAPRRPGLPQAGPPGPQAGPAGRCRGRLDAPCRGPAHGELPPAHAQPGRRRRAARDRPSRRAGARPRGRRALASGSSGST